MRRNTGSPKGASGGRSEPPGRGTGGGAAPALSPLVKVLGLWEREGCNGPYLAGRLGDLKILILPNRDHEEGDRNPTHVVLVTPAGPRPGSEGGR